MIKLLKVCVILLIIVGVVGLAMLFSLLLKTREPLPEIDLRYRDARLPTEERIDALIQSMSIEEKIAQMALVEKNSLSLEDSARYGVGGILSGAGAKPETNTKEGWREMVESYEAATRAARLGIPALYGADAVHGHGNVPGATIFPHMIGLGAADNTMLTRKVARATGEELAATGIYWSYSPTLDLPQDIRWGRVYEAFSDDPLRTAALGAAYVDGLEDARVMATPKHYLGAGAMEWNTSSNENYKIDQGTTRADLEHLESYLAPFKSAIDAGARSVMAGLASWGDEKMSASPFLLTETLKERLGFTGFIVSDWYAVYEIPGSKYDAAVTAINAGIDMVMLPFEYQDFIRNGATAVRSGDIREARIDDAVRRILRTKFELGLFDGRTPHNLEVVGSVENRLLAREAVAASTVILKNTARALPLRSADQHIRIAGSAADNVGIQAGAWTVEWQGIDGNWLPGATSILQGIREVVPQGTEIEYEMDAQFSDGRIADVGIAFVGEKPYAEGWGDRELPTLSVEDLAAIGRLKQSTRRVIVVLITGRPLIITDDLASWDALAVAWLPGSEGAGVADILFGRVKPSGTLPLPWPRSTAALPLGLDQSTADGSQLLYRRDAGLTF